MDVSRTIAHLDIDAFYASVELQRRPELAGKPVIVSGSGPRAVVTTASYEARRFGVGSAMPTSRARRLCPEAIIVPPDFQAYRDVSQKVMAIVRETIERVDVVGLDEAYLDLTGLMSPRAAMRRLVTDIREATAMSASVGIGPNRVVAKVASDAEKPKGFVCLTREQACARFADHAPGLIPGVGPKTAERLADMGITTIAALGAADEAALAARFGPRQGPWLSRLGRFDGSDAIETDRIRVSESKETTFDTDIADPAEMEVQILRLAESLCTSLDRPGRTVSIKVRLDDWTTVTRSRTLGEATGEYAVVSRIALELLREYAPARPVRLLGVCVASLNAPVAAEPPRPAGQLALPV